MERVQAFYATLPVQSGDALLSRAFWSILGLGPTDPGVPPTAFCNATTQPNAPAYAAYHVVSRRNGTCCCKQSMNALLPLLLGRLWVLPAAHPDVRSRLQGQKGAWEGGHWHR